jgi:hypothetical protein
MDGKREMNHLVCLSGRISVLKMPDSTLTTGDGAVAEVGEASRHDRH